MDNRRHLSLWERMIDALDTGGGYILMFVFVMFVGIFLIKMGYDKDGFGIITGAVGWFYGRTKDGRSNRDASASETTHTTSTVSTTSETPATAKQTTPPTQGAANAQTSIGPIQPLF